MHRNFEKIDILTIYQFSCLDNYSSVNFKFFMTNYLYLMIRDFLNKLADLNRLLR